MILVPENFAAYTISRAGEAGRQWIERLPELVADCCRHWKLEIEGEPMHGGLSVVVPVRQGSQRCILKVGWIDESTAQETLALAAWNGNGAVRLLASQSEQGTMLLERLDSRRSLNDVPIEEAISIAGTLLRRLAIPSPPGIYGLNEAAKHLVANLPDRWERCGRPLREQWLKQACALAAELGPAAGDLLVNYDLIYADVLAGEREPWLVVDPKVVRGDVEYGIAQLLWRRLEEMEAQRGLDYYFHALTEAAGLDPEQARRWTFVRCVDYWLWGTSVGLTEDPKRCETILNWLT